MQPTLRNFEIPDIGQPELAHRLACWQWGESGALPPVLCVHGLTRNGRDFDVLAGTLSDARQVLCPDMPGRGKSEWLKNPAGYSYPAYLADIAGLRGALTLNTVDWIGTSMGGILGMMVVGSFPGMIRGLVLNDVGCLIPAAGLKRILSYAGAAMSFATRAEAEAALRARCATFGIGEEWQWQLLFAHSFITLTDGRIGFACDPAIGAAFPLPDAIADVNLWPLWEAVKQIPVLLIRGAQSDILPREIALQMRDTHPRLTLHEVPDCGHAPALMDSAQVALIRDWLNKL